MERARLAVRSGEVTRAVRGARIGGLEVTEGQHLGFSDGRLVAVGDGASNVVTETWYFPDGSNHTVLADARSGRAPAAE